MMRSKVRAVTPFPPYFSFNQCVQNREGETISKKVSTLIYVECYKLTLINSLSISPFNLFFLLIKALFFL